MTHSTQVWVVDDDRSIRWVLEKALKQSDLEVTSFDSADKLIMQLQQEEPAVIITDIRMPGMDGFELLKAINQSHPNLPVIIMTAHSDLDSAVSAYQGGAFEYLPKPFDVDDALELVRKAINHRQKRQPKEKTNNTEQSQEIIGEAPAMQEVFRAIGRLSGSKMTVLINGESGTGKELVAHALHRHSPRSDAPFIALNTAAIPKDLLESELFGHEKGAFTGAQGIRRGRFEQADEGTLFLDEIGDMPAELQTRLLRVLADGEFYRVGGHTPIKVDVRIIAATHQNLEQRVKEGQFREDLFHRLNVIRIHLPSLRERREDIPLLAEHFLQAVAIELGEKVKTLSAEVKSYISRLDWHGNVRQLENMCRWLTVMAPSDLVHLEDMPPELKEEGEQASNSTDWENTLRQWADWQLSQGDTDIIGDALPRFERILIETALKQTNGHRQEASRLLGWGRNTLTRKIKELEMDAD